METTQRLPRILQRLVEAAMVLVAMVTVIVLIAVAVTDGGLGVPIQFSLDPDTHSVTSESWGTGTVVDGQGVARFSHRSASLVVLFVGAVLTYSVPIVVLLFLLRRFLRAVADGRPFARENAIVMRWIGLIVIVFGVVAQALQSTSAVIAMNTFATEGIHLEASLVPDFALVFTGLVVLVLAEAFRYGSELQAEADLTV